MAQPQGASKSANLPFFTRILLVTDFSLYSEMSVPCARLLAEYYGALLFVAHVIRSEGGAGSEAENRAQDVAKAQLRKFLAESSLGEVPKETIIAQGGVWEAIAALVEEKRIDLIVLGTHGRSGVGKLLLGSVAQRIFNLAPCPVLSVSPRARLSAAHRLTRILYATDFSPDALKALPYALSLAKVSQAELLLLHVPDAAQAASIRPEIAQGYHRHLNALIPPEERGWCRSDTLVAAGDPAEAILEAAAQYNPELIVIGAHAVEGPLSAFQVPLSTAYRVVADAPCPVLRIRS